MIAALYKFFFDASKIVDNGWLGGGGDVQKRKKFEDELHEDELNLLLLLILT